ncbi:MAG: biotin--[acetyl-CoA-carboxylase] ligase [Hyphomicrobiaceae bacterium]|nr:biotin--[acetyl-CoA-carboxylase] ligase [Hyphomicrobiaceae bacterium]
MVDFRLGPIARGAGYSVHGFESVESTNLRALEHPRAGGGDRVWFAALEQTAGRGRRGRQWSSSKGNLAASVLISAAPGQAGLANLGFVAGVSTYAALARLVDEGDARLALKWPNDVLYDGHKLVGILIEAETAGDRVNLAIGIGVNVSEAPTGLPYAATSLSKMGIAAGAETVFELLAEAFSHWFGVWNLGAGLADVLDYWRAHAAGLGERIVVRQTDGSFEGSFERLDDEGRLIVRMDDGSTRLVTAADVFPAAAAPVERTEA